MYWNLVDNMCYKFTIKFHYAPTRIIMSKEFYEGLFNEIYGVQHLALVKNNSIRGLYIIIEYNIDNNIWFYIEGNGEDTIVQYRKV